MANKGRSLARGTDGPTCSICSVGLRNQAAVMMDFLTRC